METPALIIILIILSGLAAVLGCAYFTLRDVMSMDLSIEDEIDTRHYDASEEDAHPGPDASPTKPGSLG